MLNQYMSPLSPSAIQDSLQTSTPQDRHRTTGVAMSLIKKCDVKSHFAARRAKLRLQRRAASLPGATGFSGKAGHLLRTRPNWSTMMASLLLHGAATASRRTDDRFWWNLADWSAVVETCKSSPFYIVTLNSRLRLRNDWTTSRILSSAIVEMICSAPF